MTKDTASLTDGLLRMEIGASGTRIFDVVKGGILIDGTGRWPLLPVINGEILSAAFGSCRALDNGWEIELTTAAKSVVAGVTLTMKCRGDSIEISSRFILRRNGQLNALEIFPAGTGLNLYDVVNFRNRHNTPATWPELLLGQELATSTYSDDWQFAPHPTALILRKAEASLFVGFAGLQPSFGMRMEAKKFRLQRWDLNFGLDPHGLALAEGQIFESAPLRIFLRRDQEIYETFAEFGRLLILDGLIPDPMKKPRFDWWREPLYCTWGDQWMLADNIVATTLAEQTAESAVPAAERLTEGMLWQAVGVIQRERLPIRTIILDEGWAVARGDWRPHPERFPDMRRVVDRLHALGFKVMIWWNWAEVADNAIVDPQHLAGDAWRNKHSARWRDYSDPAVQNEYLGPLFRTFFSSEDGCLDLDGVKTDFLADKVHPETPLSDPSWRGEEVYFYKITEFFYTEMRKYKPDALHLGCAGNYWLADLMDLNRTYDVASSDWREHEERGKMLLCTAPGVPVSYDMMPCTENTERWVESAAGLDASIEIGNVLCMRPNILSAPQPADATYFEMLRQRLGRRA